MIVLLCFCYRAHRFAVPMMFAGYLLKRWLRVY